MGGEWEQYGQALVLINDVEHFVFDSRSCILVKV